MWNSQLLPACCFGMFCHVFSVAACSEISYHIEFWHSGLLFPAAPSRGTGAPSMQQWHDGTTIRRSASIKVRTTMDKAKNVLRHGKYEHARFMQQDTSTSSRSQRHLDLCMWDTCVFLQASAAQQHVEMPPSRRRSGPLCTGPEEDLSLFPELPCFTFGTAFTSQLSRTALRHDSYVNKKLQTLRALNVVQSAPIRILNLKLKN